MTPVQATGANVQAPRNLGAGASRGVRLGAASVTAAASRPQAGAAGAERGWVPQRRCQVRERAGGGSGWRRGERSEGKAASNACDRATSWSAAGRCPTLLLTGLFVLGPKLKTCS
jgi:hypothetical protein